MDQDAAADAWSPANNPYAIAVSEAQWWIWAAELCARRIREGRDHDRQIDTRLFIVALRQLLYAAEMEMRAVQHLDLAVRRALREACKHFQQAVPGSLTPVTCSYTSMSTPAAKGSGSASCAIRGGC